MGRQIRHMVLDQPFIATGHYRRAENHQRFTGSIFDPSHRKPPVGANAAPLPSRSNCPQYERAGECLLCQSGGVVLSIHWLEEHQRYSTTADGAIYQPFNLTMSVMDADA